MKNASRSLLIAPALAVALVSSVSARAMAQDTPPPPPPPPAATASSGGGAGLGVGAFAFLTGLTGAAVSYDQLKFHVEGLLGFANIDGAGGMGDDLTLYRFGVRGWYHLHQGSNSDFSLGGGIGVARTSAAASATATIFEPGAMARVFLTPNVALYGLVGFAVVVGDSNQGSNEGFLLGGQTTEAFGFTYYFR